MTSTHRDKILIRMNKDTANQTEPQNGNGWVKLHRDIMRHWIWKDAKYFQAWCCIIMEANHTDQKVLIGGQTILCKRGQSVNSLKTWASRFGKGWTVQKVRTFLNLLKNESIINTEGLLKTTRITVCNYDTYQSQQQANNFEITSEQHAANTQPTTNKKEENVKNEKESGGKVVKSNDTSATLHISIEEDKKKSIWNKEYIERITKAINNEERSTNRVTEAQVADAVQKWVKKKPTKFWYNYKIEVIKRFIVTDMFKIFEEK